MSVTVSSASVVASPVNTVVSGVVSGANKSAATSFSALQSASPESVDGAASLAQGNDFEAILSPMLTAAGVVSPVLAATVASPSLPISDAVIPGASDVSDPALALQSLVTASAISGSALPSNGNDLPGLAEDLAAGTCGELAVTADLQNLLPAKSAKAENVPALSSADETQQDSVLSDLVVSLALPVSVPQIPTDQAASCTDEAANTASTDVSLPVDLSLLAVPTALSQPTPAPAAEVAAGVVDKASVMLLSSSGEPAAKLGASDAADTDVISGASLQDDELPVDAKLLAADLNAPATPGTETVSIDKETFGRLLASSQLADSITDGVQRGDTAMRSTELPRSASGAIAYRLQGQEMVATTLVPQSFDSDSWGNEIGDRVVWFSSNHIQHAEIELDPPELGPLQVRISTQNDQTTVSFTSHHAGVREVLDQNLPKLKELFADQGINLVQADVSERRGPPQDQNGNGSADKSSAGEPAIDEELASVEADTRPVITARRGLIDAFA